MRVRASGVRRILFYLLVAGFATFLLFPFYWAVVTSLKTGSGLFAVDPFPKNPAWSNYAHVFSEQAFLRNILNSVLVAAISVSISLLVGTLAAYALARMRFRGRGMVLGSFLMISMFPQIAVLSGLFELIRTLHLYNHPLGLALSYTIFMLPFTAWTLMSFMKEIPKAVEEAARLDGASNRTIIVRIVAPLMAPAFVTSGLLASIAAWNEFLFALTFTLSDQARTVPVAIALMSGSSQHELPWGNIMAASVVVTVPLILLALLFQRRIVSGLTAGSVKS